MNITKRLRAIVRIAAMAAMAMTGAMVLSGIASRPASAQILVRAGSNDTIPFLLTDSATGQVGQTGKAGSCTVIVKREGGSSVAGAGTVSEYDSTNFPGVYLYTPTTSETAIGTRKVAIHVTCSGCTVVDSFANLVGYDYTSALLSLTTPLTTTPTAGTAGEALFNAAHLAGRRNIAQGATSTTITLDASASSVNGTYAAGYRIEIASGTGAGQNRTIIGYVGSTKVVTVDRTWDTTPDNTSQFIIYPIPQANLGMIAGQTASAAAAVTFPAVISSLTGTPQTGDAYAQGVTNAAAIAGLPSASTIVSVLFSSVLDGSLTVKQALAIAAEIPTSAGEPAAFVANTATSGRYTTSNAPYYVDTPYYRYGQAAGSGTVIWTNRTYYAADKRTVIGRIGVTGTLP